MTQLGSRNPDTDQMPAAPSAIPRYTPVAMALHWIMAALVLFAGIFGLLLDDWPKATRMFWINVHVQVGVLILVLLMARLWWRRIHSPPPLPPELGEISLRLSNPAHRLIYVLMLVTPLVGIVALVWHARAFDFGFFTIDFGVKANKPVYERAEDIHLWLTYGLFGLVAGHAVVALWHHFISRNTVMLRMLPNGLSAPRSTSNDSGLVQAKSS
jgi:cytochrome b561